MGVITKHGNGRKSTAIAVTLVALFMTGCSSGMTTVKTYRTYNLPIKSTLSCAKLLEKAETSINQADFDSALVLINMADGAGCPAWQIHYYTGLTHNASGKFDLAAEQLGLSLNYRPAPNPRERAKIYLAMGHCSENQARFAQAALHYRMATNLDPLLTEAAQALSRLNLTVLK